MEIIATGDGGWAFGVAQLGDFKWKADKGGGLILTAPKPRSVMVDVWGGDIFLEVVNGAGEVINESGGGWPFFVEVTKEPVTLRYKNLPDPKLSKAELNKARKSVTRYLCSDFPHSLGVPDDLAGVIKWFEKKLKEIPAGCRKRARVDFSNRYSHGESYDNLKITYEQPETDEEVIHRVQVERERGRLGEEAERAKFQKLKAKYCPLPEPPK